MPLRGAQIEVERATPAPCEAGVATEGCGLDSGSEPGAPVQAALLAVRRQEVHSCLETGRPFSITVTFCTFRFQRRRVAFFDQGRLFPYWGPRLQFSHLAILSVLLVLQPAGRNATHHMVDTSCLTHVAYPRAGALSNQGPLST
jgi:hypothetical protein